MNGDAAAHAAGQGGEEGARKKPPRAADPRGAVFSKILPATAPSLSSNRKHCASVRSFCCNLRQEYHRKARLISNASSRMIAVGQALIPSVRENGSFSAGFGTRHIIHSMVA